jgi:hypothetical protein
MVIAGMQTSSKRNLTSMIAIGLTYSNELVAFTTEMPASFFVHNSVSIIITVPAHGLITPQFYYRLFKVFALCIRA